ncbi:MAG: dihydroorotate dehydrogenase electron transfer subunit, partial [Acidobacteria bacterium]|nr:dihydroorotate dehydrogenase electron transfer subunit [Acidobacteriota bacterium]
MPVDVEAEVLSNVRLSDEYNILSLAAEAIATSTAPGQFVMIKPSRGLDPLLRRPYSVFEIIDESGTPRGVSLLNKKVGAGSRMLYELRAGDRVACLGPLGVPFETVAPPQEALMVAGGVGVAPFATLAAALARRGTRSTLFYGARTGHELFRVDLFASLGVRLVLSTEDGSRGARGFVTAPLEDELRRLASSTDMMVYACGP